jgi:ferric-dicitrate binding protein FerR (iron transport regulator)
MTNKKYIQWLLLEPEGLLSESEVEELHQWMLESEENKQLAEKVRQSASIVASYQKDLNINLDTSYEEFKNKQAIIPTSQTIFRARPKMGYLKWAAGILIITVILFLIWDQFAPKQTAKMVGPISGYMLPDGSRLWLGEASEFLYAFDEKLRWSSLRGKAYFEVIADAQKPFETEVPQGKITVLGTAYEIETSDSSQVKVLVKSGKVLYTDIEHSDSTIVNSAEVGFRTAISGMLVQKLDPDIPIASWRQPKFEFRSVPLDSVLNTLQTYYPVEFTAQDRESLSCRINFTFDLVAMDSILLGLETLLEVKFTEQVPGQYLVSGKGFN